MNMVSFLIVNIFKSESGISGEANIINNSDIFSWYLSQSVHKGYRLKDLFVVHIFLESLGNVQNNLCLLLKVFQKGKEEFKPLFHTLSQIKWCFPPKVAEKRDVKRDNDNEDR